MSGNQVAFPMCCVSFFLSFPPDTCSELPVMLAFCLPFQILFPKEKLKSFWLPVKIMTKKKKRHTLNKVGPIVNEKRTRLKFLISWFASLSQGDYKVVRERKKNYQKEAVLVLKPT